jgi:hypothetical protein
MRPSMSGRSQAVPAPAADDPTQERLKDQIGWYDRKSADSQRRYKWLKLLELAVAAALPVVAGIHSPVWVTGGLAAVIVVLEGVQHLYQFQEHWITYRSTAEALKHERYLYLDHPDRAGPCTLPCSWIGQGPSPPGSRVVHRPRAAGPALTA